MEALMAVEITRTDMSASELRAKAARTKDAKRARRMLAIALVLEDEPCRAIGPSDKGE
jgi:hypothetical protein